METIEIELTRIFTKVVQQGSFTKAAHMLKIPKSTVSKAVKRLEDISKTKLLLRTTRSQTLTEAGKTYYESCVGPIQALEEAQKHLNDLDSVMAGNIKITAPEDIGVNILSPIVGKLSELHPKLSFQILLTDEVVDLVKNGLDLAVRLGKLKDSQLKARYVGNLELILVASPKYIAKNTLIKSPQDLAGQRILSISDLSISKTLFLQNGKKKSKTIVNPTIMSNQMSSLIEMVKVDAGILLVPSFLCKRELEKGELVRVLPNWCNRDYPVHIVSSVSMLETARLKLVSDLFFNEMKKSLGSSLK